MKIKNASMILSVVFGLFLFCAGEHASAQTQDSSNANPKEVVQLRDCGLKMNVLFSLLQFSKPEDVVFVISHLGKNETSKFGKRRLFNLKTFLTDDNLKYRKNPALVIVAEGEQSSDKGHVDIYVGGRLEVRFIIETNSDFYLGDCGAGTGDKPCDIPYDKKFFPCNSKKGKE